MSPRTHRLVTLAALGALGLLAACAESEPQSTVSRGLVSGVTSSNGGSMAPSNFGAIQTGRRAGPSPDTGNMAFPNPLPQGELTRTRVY